MLSKVSKVSKVIVLGSAALKIGEAGEFDYSGSQAIKALKEEGITTILVNPNIATIQTSEHLADKVYFLPVNPQFVEKVIAKERPDGILLSFGGQTALNCGLELGKLGILEKYQVQVLGTPLATIAATEDRGLFARKLQEIDVKMPRSVAVHNSKEAISTAKEIGYPVMVRSAYALGGLGSGVCTDEEELLAKVNTAFAHTSQILVEECLRGWKEIEYEVVRDCYDNCITVCNMENFDPLGIHTGESIVVAPSQTLSNREYHGLREISIRVIRHLGVVGECNIQFALDPKSLEYRVIEVNARLSRSSALASKATGYPLAFVAAKLALNYGLTDLKNAITQTTMACFEPALDYIVVKIPRWDLKKFRHVSSKIGSEMKSVGEVMAIGRTFEETIQKALRMLQTGFHGLVCNDHLEIQDFNQELKNPTDERIFAIPVALQAGMTIEEIHQLTYIDPWFLHKINNVLQTQQSIKKYAGGVCPKQYLWQAKQMGFSDYQIAEILHVSEDEIRKMRKNYGIHPNIKQIDTLGAEYPAQTNYLYLTYNGTQDDPNLPHKKKSVMVLGSGVYRIGSSVEFDWCCVNTVMALRKMGYRTIMINYNPETVSTDYDECDQLYFDEISLENVWEIYEKEKPLGVVVSMGGQTPNNLALEFERCGIRVLGTSPQDIDNAENRHKFSSLLDQIKIDQPQWSEVSSIGAAKEFASEVKYPVLVRPSYVLSGAAMGVASNDRELQHFLERAVEISQEFPVVISKFLENAKEVEFDAVAAKGEILIYAISEHVENAGVHSGDATLVTPPQRIYVETIRRIRHIARKIAQKLNITGPFNIQFLAKENEVKVIECNLRASRSFPFVSKVYKTNFIKIATQAFMEKYPSTSTTAMLDLDYVGVKAPQFSFARLQGADPTLGVEMASTGEVGCLGDDFEEAFLKAMISVGLKLPIRNVLISTGPLEKKVHFISSAKLLQEMGINIFATEGTATFLAKYNIPTTTLYWPLEEKSPNTIEYIENRQIDLVINIPKNYQEEELTNDYIIRRKAVDFGVFLITNLQVAQRLIESMYRKKTTDLAIKSWEEYTIN